MKIQILSLTILSVSMQAFCEQPAKVQVFSLATTEVMHQTQVLFIDGKYEDYLEHFGNDKIHLNWKDFQMLQNRLKKAIQSSGFHEKKIEFWMPHLATFFLLYSKRLQQDELKTVVLWQEYISAFGLEKNPSDHLLPLVQAIGHLKELDVLTQLTLPKDKSKLLFESLKCLPDETLDLAFFIYFLKSTQERNILQKQEAYATFFAGVEKTRQLIISTNASSKEEITQIFFDAKANVLGLDPKSPLSTTITYLSALLGVQNAESAKDLKQSLLELNPEDLATILEIFEEKDALYLRFDELRQFLLFLFAHPNLGNSQHLKLQNFIKYALPLVVKVIAQNKKMAAKKELDPASFIQFDRKQVHLPSEVTLWTKIQPVISKEGIVAIH